MSSLHWSDDYSLNIPAIDNEHKLLIAIINDIEHSMRYHGPLRTQVIAESMRRLSNYIRTHFESEERFMLTCNYPEFDDHKAQHTELLEKLARFESRFKNENKAFNEEMLLFLQDWLIRHIILHDIKIGHFYHDSQRSNPAG